MFAYAGSTVMQHPFENWSLLFARQPEPDLDFEEDLADDTQRIGGQSPQSGKPPKRKGTNPLTWLLLIVLLGGGAYLALDPEGAMNVINSFIGESPAPVTQAPPPRPAPPAPVASAPPTPIPATPVPSTPPPTAAAPTMPASTPTPSSPLAMKPAAPLYGEGQRVTIGSPAPLTLSQDATGRLPGPSVKPGSILVVLDGELQAGGWTYHVRTETGDRGWLQERQLRLIP